MLYASMRLILLKSLGSTVFTDSIFATSKEDLTANAYASHLRHVAAPQPLSTREQEMVDLRAAERETASYDGSRARTSHIGTGVGLNWSEEVERAVIELGQGTGPSIVILSVDPQSETLTLRSTEDIPVSSLGSSLPASEPCYALFSWERFGGPNAEREIIFIYSCPSNSPIKNRMIYSSGSTSTFQTAKDILTSLSPPVTVVSRKVETSDPTELDEEYLKAELGCTDRTAPPAETSRGFSRPKRPPRRH
jgi:twinfilin-like protein